MNSIDVHVKLVPAAKDLATMFAGVLELPRKVDRLDMVSDQATSGSLEVFAYRAGVSPWHLGALANKLVQLLRVLQVLIV